MKRNNKEVLYVVKKKVKSNVREEEGTGLVISGVGTAL
jgi:hypothetical protein